MLTLKTSDLRPASKKPNRFRPPPPTQNQVNRSAHSKQINSLLTPTLKPSQSRSLQNHICTSCVQAMPDPTPIARVCIVNDTRTTYKYAHLDDNVSRQRILSRRGPRATNVAVRRGSVSISPREIEPLPLLIAAFMVHGPLQGSIRRRLTELPSK